MLSAPVLLGYTKNKRAARCSFKSGIAMLGISLLTRYPLGAVKALPFPVHRVLEALTGVGTAAAPWLYGFAHDKRAKWVHIISGLEILGSVALTDYSVAEARRRVSFAKRPANDRLNRATYEISTAAEYDQYTARPPYTFYGDEKEQLQLVPPR
jgi:hypothetical protein